MIQFRISLLLFTIQYNMMKNKIQKYNHISVLNTIQNFTPPIYNTIQYDEIQKIQNYNNIFVQRYTPPTHNAIQYNQIQKCINILKYKITFNSLFSEM